MSDSNDTSLEQGRRSVAVIGAGAWGTAVAKACAENGHQVSLWALEAAVVESVNRDHENKTWLPGVKLPDNLSATADPVEAALAKDVIILAVPSLYLLPTLKRILAVP
ncbi:MAG TPA: glycerol-3-phosphate dehydrogenase, partial [Spirochaetaceae bacterium]|nr:glycerol-3-phosphate dehydrogenase [Spirochaetaceae bacterium]